MDAGTDAPDAGATSCATSRASGSPIRRLTHEGVLSMLTGWGISGDSAAFGAAQGISLDQKIAKAIGASLKHPTMVFATDPAGGNFNSLSWDEHNQVIPKQASPMEIFRQLFADSRLTREALAAQLARRRSILDDVQSDLTRLQSKISGDDARRFSGLGMR